MIKAMMLALAIGAGADGGTKSEMFNNQKKDLVEKATKKAVEKKAVSPFAAAIANGAEQLATKLTAKLGVATTVKEIFISNSFGAEGDAARDMAIVTFTNEKQTFAFVLIGEEGQIKVLPRDFNGL